MLLIKKQAVHMSGFLLFSNYLLCYGHLMKRIYRSKTNKVWAGIFGGLGEYFNVDPTLLRLGWLSLVVVSGFIPGFIVYIISILIVPRAPESAK